MFLLTVTLLLFIVTGCSAAEARLVPAGVQNDRAAVVAEAYYAVYGSPLSCASVPNWNYLANTAGTYWHTVGSTAWTNMYPVDGWMTNTNDAVMRQYFVNGNLPAYGRYGGYLRGGQCKYFANYILYNAGIGSTVDPMPSYSAMAGKSKSSKYARAGDVLFESGYLLL